MNSFTNQTCLATGRRQTSTLLTRSSSRVPTHSLSVCVSVALVVVHSCYTSASLISCAPFKMACIFHTNEISVHSIKNNGYWKGEAGERKKGAQQRIQEENFPSSFPCAFFSATAFAMQWRVFFFLVRFPFFLCILCWLAKSYCTKCTDTYTKLRHSHFEPFILCWRTKLQFKNER